MKEHSHNLSSGLSAGKEFDSCDEITWKYSQNNPNKKKKKRILKVKQSLS